MTFKLNISETHLSCLKIEYSANFNHLIENLEIYILTQTFQPKKCNLMHPKIFEFFKFCEKPAKKLQPKGLECLI